MKLYNSQLKLGATLVPVILALSACGGSNNNSNNNGGNSPGATTNLTGSVFASAVSGASCSASNLAGETIAGPFTTNNDGSYATSIPNANVGDDLVIACSGGTFTDEATGNAGVTAGPMSAYISGGTLSNSSAVHITPSSTIIHNLISQHGLSLADAVAAYEDAFGHTPNHSVAPTDANSPADDAEDENKLSGLHAASFSQLTHDLGLHNPARQFDLLVALAKDLADKNMDGRSNSAPIAIGNTSTNLPADIQNRYSNAFVNFRNGGRDNTGLGNNQLGVLPFATTAMTDSYKIEYVPGMRDAVNAKTEFTLKVTDHSDTAQTGLDLSVKPMMYMTMMGMTHTHSAPYEGCNENTTPGEYSCTVYYLMPSVENTGDTTGYWQLKVMPNGHMGEHAYFYPTVSRVDGAEEQIRLRGQHDKISSSMNHNNGHDMGNGGDHNHMHHAMSDHNSEETEKRTYYLFKRALTSSMNGHTFELFIAAKENMHSFPAVSTGTTLNDGSMHHELDITTMSVEVSSDKVSWVTAEEHGHHGHWIASGITGLTGNEEDTIYVRLIIEGEHKTIDGEVPAGDGTNEYGIFTLTAKSNDMGHHHH